jgi:hypothetical protein
MPDYASLEDFAAGFAADAGAAIKGLGGAVVGAFADRVDPAVRAHTPVGGQSDDPGYLLQSWQRVPGSQAAGDAPSIEIVNDASAQGAGGSDVPGLLATIEDRGRRRVLTGPAAGKRMIGSTGEAARGIAWPALKEVFGDAEGLVQGICDQYGGSE